MFRYCNIIYMKGLFHCVILSISLHLIMSILVQSWLSVIVITDLEIFVVGNFLWLSKQRKQMLSSWRKLSSGHAKVTGVTTRKLRWLSPWTLPVTPKMPLGHAKRYGVTESRQWPWHDRWGQHSGLRRADTASLDDVDIVRPLWMAWP